MQAAVEATVQGNIEIAAYSAQQGRAGRRNRWRGDLLQARRSSWDDGDAAETCLEIKAASLKMKKAVAPFGLASLPLRAPQSQGDHAAYP